MTTNKEEKYSTQETNYNYRENTNLLSQKNREYKEGIFYHP
jgi:hypothetical protein